MRPRIWKSLLPDRYTAGEFPGESLLAEMARRASWRLLPKELVRRTWERLLLGEGGFWCFILGVNNSGTTLVHDLLARHPEIRTLPEEPVGTTEGQWFTNALPRPRDYGVSRLFTERLDVFRWTEEEPASPAIRALHDWGFLYARRSGRVLLEKSPPNTVRSRWLQAHFRRPRFILVYRHPCAVAEGIRRREGHTLRAAARHWARANRALLDDRPRLERSTEVRYEDLCSDPAGTLRSLAEFLSLPGDVWRDDLGGLSVHSLDESVDTVTNFNPRSFERLSVDEMETITEEVHGVASRLGYEVPPDQSGAPA